MERGIQRVRFRLKVCQQENKMAIQTVYIRYFGPIDDERVKKLMATLEQKLKEGIERFVILISSPGGQVFHGISAYNFLKGIPAEIQTHNFGSTDSSAICLFCAGAKRLCVPHGRFLIHGIGFDVQAGARFNEKSLGEHMTRLKNERETICRIIADNTGKKLEDIEQDMLNAITLTAEQAKDYGLVHEIKSDLFEKGAEVISIT
jgi:ATP-dependent Clp endopeptidase proteolytic subunit ClpP